VSGMRILLDLDACTGHGRCYSLAPKVFGSDDLGHCELLLAEPPEELRESARRAVATCPEGALTIQETA